MYGRKKRTYSKTKRSSRRTGGYVRRSSRPARGYTRNVGDYGRYTPRREGISRGIGSRVELKYFDTVIGSSTLGTSGTIVSSSLNFVPQGGGNNQMVGRKICVKSIEIRGFFQVPSTLTTPLPSSLTADIVKLNLILDKQCNGTAALYAEIFSPTVNINSFPLLENTKRFQILKDWEIALNSEISGYVLQPGGVANGYTSGAKYFAFVFKKSVNIDLEFDNSAAARTITNVRSNNLILTGISALGAGNIQATVRIRYADN